VPDFFHARLPQIRSMQLERQGSPPFGLRLPQAKLSRNLNQVGRPPARERCEFITLLGGVAVW
jgi:hypothetical protein